MAFFNMLKSIHGRMLGISSTGGIISNVESTGITQSTDIDMAAQMWGPGMLQTIGAGATATKILNCGVTYFTTASSAAALYNVDPPAKNCFKWLVFQLSSTLVTLNTTSTLISFANSTAHNAASLASTAVAVTSSDGVYTAALLVGLSTTQYAVLSRRSTHFN